MSYLENYLELIEDLPQEIRDQFIEIRGLDLTVEQSLDSLEARVQNLFFECEADGVTADTDAEYQSIKQDYDRTLQDADEKVSIASRMYDIVSRNLRHLDGEISKLKNKLETDNEGCTAVLEQRSLELDTPRTSQQKKFKYSSEKEKEGTMSGHSSYGKRKPKMSADAETTRTIENTSSRNTDSEIEITPSSSPAKPSARRVKKSKKSSSKKASKKTAGDGVPVDEIDVEQELADAALTAVKSPQQGPTDKKKRKTTSTVTSLASTSESSSTLTSTSLITIPDADIATSPASGDALRNDPAPAVEVLVPASPQVENPPPAEEDSNEDWPADDFEPRYCVCNDVSYGDMIACDNESCNVEWFHYRCVGVTVAPAGKWYCPRCRRAMKHAGKKRH